MKQYTKSEAIRIAEQCETKEDLEKHDMHLTLNDLFIERTGMPYYSITYYNKDNKIVLLAQFWEKEQITKDYFKWLEQAPIIPFEQDALDLIKQILKDNLPIETNLQIVGFWVSKTLYDFDNFMPYKMIYFKNRLGNPRGLFLKVKEPI